MTGDKGPLGTLSSKILIGYAFGIYDEPVRDALDTVRTIRNQFAHAKRLFDFDHDLIVAELFKVTLPKRGRSKLYKNLHDVRAHAKSYPRLAFIDLCFAVAVYLLERQTKAIRAKNRRKTSYRTQVANALLNYRPTEEPTNYLARYGILSSVDPTPGIAEAYRLGSLEGAHEMLHKKGE